MDAFNGNHSYIPLEKKPLIVTYSFEHREIFLRISHLARKLEPECKVSHDMVSLEQMG